MNGDVRNVCSHNTSNKGKKTCPGIQMAPKSISINHVYYEHVLCFKACATENLFLGLQLCLLRLHLEFFSLFLSLNALTVIQFGQKLLPNECNVI